MIFSVQNSNLMYSVEFSLDLVQIQVRETVSGVFLARMDIPIQVWSLEHGGSDAKGFQRTSYDASSHHREPTWNSANYGEVSDHVGMNYPEIPDSRFVAQPVDDFLFPLEEEGSVENPITLDEDEGFSETMTPPVTQQPPAMEPRPALRSIENLQNSSAARQLFD